MTANPAPAERVLPTAKLWILATVLIVIVNLAMVALPVETVLYGEYDWAVPAVMCVACFLALLSAMQIFRHLRFGLAGRIAFALIVGIINLLTTIVGGAHAATFAFARLAFPDSETRTVEVAVPITKAMTVRLRNANPSIGYFLYTAATPRRLVISANNWLALESRFGRKRDSSDIDIDGRLCVRMTIRQSAAGMKFASDRDATLSDDSLIECPVIPAGAPWRELR